MAKFNTASARPARASYVKSNGVSTNPDGGLGVLRDEKSELFLLAVSDFVNEGSFYEGTDSRTARLRSLAGKVAVSDPQWSYNFVNWLRNSAQMRSASLVVALESAKALNDNGIAGGRKIVDAAIARADEPAEAIAYWHVTHGRKLPKSVKRGIADAATRLYNQRSLFKYDTKSKTYRFGDVVRLTHPKPNGAKQSDLFRFAVARRHDDKAEAPASLRTVSNRKEVNSLSPEAMRELVSRPDAAKALADAGITWEALSGQIAGGMDAQAWEAVIPSMGYMALLRNLRNFIAAGVDAKVFKSVLDKIADPDEVAKSRQLPMRFLSAYRANRGNLKVAAAAQDALDASLANVPVLKGRTLILVDRSGSMSWSHSQKSDLSYADTATIFGTALALAAENADLVAYGTGHERITFRKGDSVLPIVDRFRDMGGTNTAASVAATFKNHDRVIILTDEQHNGYYGNRDPGSVVPANVPLYTWNLAGYQHGHGESGKNRYYFGGLSDQSFKTIALLEAARDGSWPWEN